MEKFQYFLYILLTLGFVFIALVFLFIYVLKKRKKQLIQDYNSKLKAKQSYKILDNDTFKDEINDIEDSFPEIVRNLEAKIDGIYFVHGTFVGDDPFHLAELFKFVYPSLNKKYYRMLKKFGKKASDIFFGDFGNFTDEHTTLINKAVNKKFSYKFNWSSGNNHYSRVIASLELIDEILNNFKAGDKVILIGHSHAAQLFSLITQYLNNPAFKKYIIKNFDSELGSKIKILNDMEFIFLTLGSPKRYEWKLNKKIKLFHIINHRGDLPIGGSLRSALFTHHGDYIQQWGGHGSDIKSSVKSIQDFNKSISEWLGDGEDRASLKLTLNSKERLHSIGKHLLIDYGDNALYPNFIISGLGHGIYTRIGYLSFYLDYLSKNI